MKNKAWPLKIMVYLIFVSCIVLTALTLLTDDYHHIFIIQLTISLVTIGYAVFKFKSLQGYIHSSLDEFTSNLDAPKQSILNNFPLPIIMVRETGEIIWYNGIFRKKVLNSNDVFGEKISTIVDKLDIEALNKNSKVETIYQSKNYDIYVSRLQIHTEKNGDSEGDTTYVLYFVDTTHLHALEFEKILNNPVVSIITVDNYDEFGRIIANNEKSRILSDIDNAIEESFGKDWGVLKKLDKDRFISIQEDKYLSKMLENKFNILDQVRAISEKVKTPITLSIGVGRYSKNIKQSEQFAKQALDMALGRGGDQVVVKTPDSFEFFGGVSKSVEKRTKVRTRIVATALAELIENGDNVLVMGHRFADLDSVGAAIGIAKGVKILDEAKEVNIVINREKTLAISLIDKVEAVYGNELFISPEDAMDVFNKKTLLIIVDTHIQHFLESEEIYKQCKHVAIIDHHRKMIDHIDNAVIFYHEPSASSASEMVTELLQYFDDKNEISNVEADALLSGIMLDTRNFVLKTGVRTFEAAAYLRKLGADTVAVKKLFSSSMDSYQKKTRLVSSAEIYHRCAIAVELTPSEDFRVISAQAADELLTINDVDASFVIYEYDNKTIISARSIGVINVQLIMEKLGGGGHFTMAGVQIENLSIEDAKQKLLEAIDQFNIY